MPTINVVYAKIVRVSFKKKKKKKLGETAFGNGSISFSPMMFLQLGAILLDIEAGRQAARDRRFRNASLLDCDNSLIIPMYTFDFLV